MSGPVGRCSWCGTRFGVGCPHVSRERTADIRDLLVRLAELDEMLTAAKRRADWRAFELSDALTFAVN